MASSLDLAILIKAQDSASPVLRSVGAAANALSGAFSAPARALGGLVDGLGKIGLAGLGIQALTSGAQSLGQAMGVGLVNEMEQVSASINAFTKDGDKTKAILAEIRTEANATPFSFRELATATSALMPAAKAAGTGYMELVKQAEVLAASNPMQGLEGASFSLREAVTGDFTSIIERFNLSRTTINKLKAEGVPALEIVRRAMAEMGFDSDLVAAKAQTLEGRWSTFNDTIDTVKMTIAQPIFDVLKDALTGLQGLLDENMGAIQGFAQGTADNIKRVIDIFKALWAAFTSDSGAIGVVLDKLREMFGDQFADAIQPFLQFFMEQIPNIKTTVADAFSFIGEAIGGFWDILGGVVSVAGDAFSFIIQAIDELLGLDPGAWSSDMENAFSLVGMLGDAAGIAINVLSSVFQVLGSVISVVWSAVQPILAAIFAELGRFTLEILPLVASAWDSIWSKINIVVSAIQAFLSEHQAEISAAWATAWNAMQLMIGLIWDVITTTIRVAWDVISGLIKAALQILSGDWSGAWDTIKQIVINVWADIQSGIGSAFGRIASSIQSQWDSMIGAAAAAGWGMVSAFADNVINGARRALDAVRSIVQQIRDLLPGSDAKVGPLSDLKRAGRALPETFAKGISESSLVPSFAMLGSVTPIRANLGMASVGGPGGGAGQTINVTVNGSVTSEQDLAEMIRQRLIQTARRNGYSALGGLA